MQLHAKWFGRTLEDLPIRMGNVRISRLDNFRKVSCTYCFPHGHENHNSIWRKDLRCWKRYRQHQWRARFIMGEHDALLQSCGAPTLS